jgi:hypothetical protein
VLDLDYLVKRRCMNYDWITKALENKGVLTTSKTPHGIRSTMHFNGRDPVVGEHFSTFPDALHSLNSAIGDDWEETNKN